MGAASGTGALCCCTTSLLPVRMRVRTAHPHSGPVRARASLCALVQSRCRCDVCLRRFVVSTDKDHKVRVSVLPPAPEAQGSFEIHQLCMGHRWVWGSRVPPPPTPTPKPLHGTQVGLGLWGAPPEPLHGTQVGVGLRWG